MEVVHDDASAEQYERVSNMLAYAQRSGETWEQTHVRFGLQMLEAEKLGMPERVDDFLLGMNMLEERIERREEGVEQGKEVSNRMAGERQRRRDNIEASNDVRQAIKDSGRRPGPTFDQLQQRRYGRDWRKITKRERGRDGL